MKTKITIRFNVNNERALYLVILDSGYGGMNKAEGDGVTSITADLNDAEDSMWCGALMVNLSKAGFSFTVEPA